jgi:acyl-CoA reductase-like NAD-dependent aldehyde dehydrogenase
MSRRLAVKKTYKLYVGGAFVRSESGRHDPVHDPEGRHVANITRASRKDVRDAVKAARKAQPGWAGKTAYNRGQVLYRIAEALESRSGEFDAAESVDLLVHYAGWTDKLAHVLGGVNPVAAPFLSFSVPEPTGVVGVVAPDTQSTSSTGTGEPELLGLIGAIAPALAAGNTVVAICSESKPLPGLDLGEVLAVSDVPGGVVNLLAGRRAELAPALGAHRDLNAIVDASGDRELAVELDTLAAETVKRVLRVRDDADPREDALRRLEALTELKTAWHPVGA